jgi:hypothetical protein
MEKISSLERFLVLHEERHKILLIPRGHVARGIKASTTIATKVYVICNGADEESYSFRQPAEF